jgi:hypothetical protein
MRVSLGNPPSEEHERLVQAFREWAEEQNARFLPAQAVSLPGLEKHKPDDHVRIGGEEFLVEVETCHSIETAHTRSQWSTFWGYASQDPECNFMVVLPETCVSPNGEEFSKDQISGSVKSIFEEIEEDLSERGVALERSKLKIIML